MTAHNNALKPTVAASTVVIVRCVNFGAAAAYGER